MTGQAFFEKNLKSRYFSIEKVKGLDTIDISAEFRYASNKGYCQLTEAENHLMYVTVRHIVVNSLRTYSYSLQVERRNKDVQHGVSIRKKTIFQKIKTSLIHMRKSNSLETTSSTS